MALKLLHTVPSIDVADGGGLGGAALALHQQLLANGESSHLITTGRRGRDDGPEITALRIARHNPFFYDPRSRSVIDAAVRKADVVHAHGLYSHLNWCVGDACARWRKPLIYHPQGTLAPWYLRKRWLAKKVVHQLFENRNFAIARLWRAVSEEEGNNIHHAHPGAKVVVIPNGVYAANFPSKSERQGKEHFPSLDSSRKWVLFFGRLAAVKGLDILLDAWKKLAAFYHEWQLVIVGPNFEGYRLALDARAATFAGPGAPVILGPMVGAEKVRLLNAADLFVLPSRAEGLPVAILEALVCHLPVVVSTACNFAAATLGEAGWVCPPTVTETTEALRAALGAVPAELRRRGETARALAVANYDWKSIADAIVSASKRISSGT